MGPLKGLKVVELAGLGPAPMAAMQLADLGATVLRIDRTVPVELGMKRPVELNLLNRNRENVALDLKDPAAVRLALQIIEHADVLIEGFRPGVTERLGLGPDACLARNPRLVYGRMTGWGQDGPLAQAAGHDLNYIALTGALDAIGRPGQAPAVPMNLIGDMGGGALYLVTGILAALQERQQSGRGQVVDAAIVDGVLSLMTMQFGSLAAGLWRPPRGRTQADEGAYFYDVYECADGLWVSVAAVESRFFADLLQRLEIDPALVGAQRDTKAWAHARVLIARRFKTRTRDEWARLLEGTDTCFAPVLAIEEVEQHPHIAQRGSIVRVDDVPQPAPAPRFSRTPAATPRPPTSASRDEALASLQRWWGADKHERLNQDGALACVSGTVERTT